jgi:hypothetical protein
MQLCEVCVQSKNHGSAVGIVIGYGLDNQEVVVESWNDQECSLLHIIQVSYRAHQVSYPMGMGCKVAGEWSWSLTSN